MAPDAAHIDRVSLGDLNPHVSRRRCHRGDWPDTVPRGPDTTVAVQDQIRAAEDAHDPQHAQVGDAPGGGRRGARCG